MLGASVAAVAWVLTLVVMAIDFSIFGVSRPSYHCPCYLASLLVSFLFVSFPNSVILVSFPPSPSNHPPLTPHPFQVIKNHVNADHSGSHAYYSTAMWTILAAMLLLFFGMFIVLFTCFSARKARKNSYASNGGVGGGRRRSYKNSADAGYVDGNGMGGGNGYTDVGAAGRKPRGRFGIF